MQVQNKFLPHHILFAILDVTHKMGLCGDVRSLKSTGNETSLDYCCLKTTGNETSLDYCSTSLTHSGFNLSRAPPTKI